MHYDVYSDVIGNAIDFQELRQRAANLRTGDLIRVAEQLGWTHARTRGSHHQYTKAGAERPLTIPLDGHRSRRTTLDIIRQLEEASRDHEDD